MSILDVLRPSKMKANISSMLDVRFERVHAHIDELFTQVRIDVGAQIAENRAELADLRAECYELTRVFSTPPYDAALHRLRSASVDIERGLAALKNEISAQLSFSLHDLVSQMADQRRWLERINEEFSTLQRRLPEQPGLTARPEEALTSISEQQARLEKTILAYTTALSHLEVAVRSQFSSLQQLTHTRQTSRSDSEC
jgi:chromosome segregation ATPase